MVTDSKPQSTSAFANPWTQLILGIICMVMVANLQYGWTLFVGPIGAKFGWTKAAIQYTFTLSRVSFRRSSRSKRTTRNA